MSFSLTASGSGAEVMGRLDTQLQGLTNLTTLQAIRLKLLAEAVAEFVKDAEQVSVLLSGHLANDDTGSVGVSISMAKPAPSPRLPLAIDPLAASQVNASGPALARSTPQPGNPPIGGNT